MQTMLDMGVSTRRGIMCAHRERAYATEPWSCGAGAQGCGCPAEHCSRLAESERAQEQTIILPLFHQMTDDEQGLVAQALQEACSARAIAV
jgi:dTDP-4-amino-4,6-dideoxygalactose transaminase